MTEVIEQGRKNGYVETLFGRRRQLPGLLSRNQNSKHLAERQALNSPIQGTAADIIKLAMLAVENELKKNNFKSRLLLQVHDELVLEVVESELNDVSNLVRHAMENAANLSVPLRVSINFGKNWADAK